MGEKHERHWLGKGMLSAFSLALAIGAAYLLNYGIALALVMWAVLGGLGVGGLEVGHRLGGRREARQTTTTTEPPSLRMDDHLTTDTATRNHLVYFRLRFWNDGEGAITPEVRVTRVILSNGKEAPFSAQLPLLLPWSSLKAPPALTCQHTSGETVGVLGALNWTELEDGRAFPIDPPLLYVAGAQHNPQIGQTDQKVFVRVQAIVPGQSIPVIERWFWVQIAKAAGGYDVRDGHVEQAPPESPGTAGTDETGSTREDDESIDRDLRQLIEQRLTDIPLRPYEIEIIVLILRDAISSLDNLPVVGMQPGNSATDIQATGQRRQGADGEQMWHMPTKFKALGGGIILSDQTLATLTDLHGHLMKLRREVYDRYHPPVVPGSRR